MRDRRRALGMTQDELARRSGVSLSTVKCAESGKPVAPATARCLTAALGLPYAGVVQAMAEVVERQLQLSGFSPTRHAGPWVGREGELASLKQAVGAGPGVWCIVGPSGIGKSALARILAAEVSALFPDGVLWVNASCVAAAPTAVRADIAEALGFGDVLPDPDRVSADAYAEAFAARLFAVRRLLVLDDVHDVHTVSTLVPSGRPCWIVATTARRPRTVPAGWNVSELGPLDPGESGALLAALAGGPRLSVEPQATQSLLDTCRGSPEQLRIVGHLLAKNPYLRVEDALAEVRAGTDESPLTAHWARHLPASTRAPLADLAVLGRAPFSARWTAAMTGLDDGATRRLLGALHDVFVLEESSSGAARHERRFRFSPHAEAFAGGTGRITAAHVARCLPLRPTWVTGPREQVLAELRADLPQWRAMFRFAARAVLGEPHRTPYADLAEVPAPLPDIPPSVSTLLTDPLLHVLVRFFSPRESSSWIAAAMSLARERGDDRLLGALAALYAWWWFARLGAAGLADAWATAAWEHHRRAGVADSVVQFGCHASLYAWLARGHAAAAAIREESLGVARSADVRWETRASVLIAAAASRALRGDPESARSLLTEARGVVPDGPSRDEVLARAVIALDLAVCDRLLDRPPGPAAPLAAAALDLRDLVLGSYPLPTLRLDVLCRWLGVETPWKPTGPDDVILATPLRCVTDATGQLTQLCAELGVPLPDVSPEAAAVPTRLGRLSRMGITIARGDSHDLDLHLDLLSPVEALHEVLSGENAALASAFAQRLAPLEHRLRPALADLAARGGLAP